METINDPKDSSFVKGEAFEDYIQKNIFSEKEFVLVNSTPLYSQNKKRFIESSKDPDFKFRIKNLKKEIYVEAKWRNNFNSDDKIELFKESQFNRFRKHFKNKRLYVAVGIGGKPDNPDSVSLIPIQALKYRYPYKSVINKFTITKETLNYKFYISDIHKKVPEIRRRKIIRKTLFFGLIFFTLISITFLASEYYSNSNRNSQLINVVNQYYLDVESNDVDKILTHLHNPVEGWFGKVKPSLSQIKEDIISYQNKYPFKKVKIVENSFKYHQLKSGYFETEYLIDYSIKEKVHLKYKTFLLKIKSVWTEDYKLVDMSEEIFRKNS